VPVLSAVTLVTIGAAVFITVHHPIVYPVVASLVGGAVGILIRMLVKRWRRREENVRDSNIMKLR
jgi:hypothetical protein